MRNCPICGGSERHKKTGYEAEYILFECNGCGMHFLDRGEITQSDFDYYYSLDTSPDLHDLASMARLSALAEWVKSWPGRGMDIGGKYSELRGMVPGIEAVGAGEALQGAYDYVLMSHTMEHVYDVDGLMRNIQGHLNSLGRLLIEGPIWPDYSLPSTYDFYWQHVNKFTPEHLKQLLDRYGFRNITGSTLPNFGDFHCYRIEGILGGEDPKIFYIIPAGNSQKAAMG